MNEVNAQKARSIITETDLEDMQKIAARMLNTEVNDVALQVESLVDGISYLKATSKFEHLNCSGNFSISDHTKLIPIESGNAYPMYQVTVCSKNTSWFGNFMSNNSNDQTITIASSSVMPGR